jgi:hypothetical protein
MCTSAVGGGPTLQSILKGVWVTTLGDFHFGGGVFWYSFNLLFGGGKIREWSNQRVAGVLAEFL